MSKLKYLKNPKTILDILKGIKLLAIAFVCLFLKNNKRYRDLWLIEERWSEARDNGYWLFKYIMDNKLHNNVWYVINPDSIDIHKLKKYSHRLIDTFSIRHYAYYSMCTRGIDTQLNFGSPLHIVSKYFKKLMPVKKTDVYLGHGIHKDDVDFLYKKNSRIDLFITDNDLEARECIEIQGYSPREAVVTGRPRNDGLNDFKTEKEILFMPTNRIWFLDWTKEVRDANFLESRFYKEYQGFINDPSLHELLKKTGYKLLFFLHTNTYRFFKHFSTDCPDIILVDKKDMGVQEALKRAELFVTDYSSVAFDFSYMKKPVVYYHYDYETFRKSQYKEGWFSYAEHGVGDIVETREELIRAMEDILNRGCVMAGKYLSRVKNIYKFQDDNNCRRVFDAIVNAGGDNVKKGIS